MTETWVSDSTLGSTDQDQTRQTRLSIVVVGGKRMVRLGIAELLSRNGVAVKARCFTEDQFQQAVEEDSRLNCDLLLLLLEGGSFSSIHHIRDILNDAHRTVPLLVLSEQTGRGQVYAALRIGAKACLDLDSDPEELLKAVEMTRSGKVYLSPDVAELLVTDVSAAFEPTSKTRSVPSVELSRREVEIVQLLCEGLSSKEIARRLHLSAKTVENHRYNIYRKCDVDSIAALMRYAIQRGLVGI